MDGENGGSEAGERKATGPRSKRFCLPESMILYRSSMNKSARGPCN